MQYTDNTLPTYSEKTCIQTTRSYASLQSVYKKMANLKCSLW